jgi:hypothetical protein
MNEAFHAFHKDSPHKHAMRSEALANMKKLLAKKPELYDLMTPDWYARQTLVPLIVLS